MLQNKLFDQRRVPDGPPPPNVDEEDDWDASSDEEQQPVDSAILAELPPAIPFHPPDVSQDEQKEELDNGSEPKNVEETVGAADSANDGPTELSEDGKGKPRKAKENTQTNEKISRGEPRKKGSGRIVPQKKAQGRREANQKQSNNKRPEIPKVTKEKLQTHKSPQPKYGPELQRTDKVSSKKITKAKQDESAGKEKRDGKHLKAKAKVRKKSPAPKSSTENSATKMPAEGTPESTKITEKSSQDGNPSKTKSETLKAAASSKSKSLFDGESGSDTEDLFSDDVKDTVNAASSLFSAAALTGTSKKGGKRGTKTTGSGLPSWMQSSGSLFDDDSDEEGGLFN